MSDLGCRLRLKLIAIILNADDILLLGAICGVPAENNKPCGRGAMLEIDK